MSSFRVINKSNRKTVARGGYVFPPRSATAVVFRSDRQYKFIKAHQDLTIEEVQVPDEGTITIEAYPCPQCDFVGRTKRSLSTHIGIKHKEG